MTIKYSDGRAVEAVLLARTESTMRVAIEGADDVMQFSNIRGTWLSSACEPVEIEFAWQRQNPKPAVSEADCYCSPELAARLMLLFTDSSEDTGLGAPTESTRISGSAFSAKGASAAN